MRFFVAVAVAVGLALAGWAVAGAGPGRAGAGAAGDPSVFAASQDSGSRTEVDLRSVATGRLVRRLAGFADFSRRGPSITENGFAFSPDGRDIYLTLVPGRRTRSFHLLLERIDAATRRRSLIAYGQEPAVSPDGTRLAYTTVSGRTGEGVAVRDLATGHTQRLDISALIGRKENVVQAAVAWLGDGDDIAVIPTQDAIALDRPTHPAVVSAAGSPSRFSTSCMIVVHVGAAGQALTARRITFSVPGGFGDPYVLAPDADDPGSLMLAMIGRHDDAVVARVTPGATSAAVHELVSIPRAQALSFSPSGARLLYIQGHRPPALWVAGIVPHHLVGARRLIRNSNVGAAW